MKYIKQLALILSVSFVGEILHHFIPLPIPSGIYGIVIMFILLQTKIIPLSSIEKTADFLIEIMPLMFIPASVGILDSWGVIKDSVVFYVITVIVSTIAVMAVSGLTAQLISSKKAGKTGKK